jgi:hypothetical protein
MKYQQKLMTQEWARFRDSVLEQSRDSNHDEDSGRNARCQQCGASEKDTKLQIHHLQYRRNSKGQYRDPWAYDYEDVKILCSDCHSHLHGIAKQIEHWMIGLRFEEAEELLSLMQAIQRTGSPRAISYCKNYAYTLSPGDFCRPAEARTIAAAVEEVLP